MKRNIALISGIATGFLSLLLMAHFAGIRLHGIDYLPMTSLLLTFISITLLLSDGQKRKTCSRNLK